MDNIMIVNSQSSKILKKLLSEHYAFEKSKNRKEKIKKLFEENENKSSKHKE